MHRYKAVTPMGSERKFVHLRAFSRMSHPKFVCFERSAGGFSISDDIITAGARYFLTAARLDAETIRGILAQINHCEAEEIEITDASGRIVPYGSTDDP